MTKAQDKQWMQRVKAHYNLTDDQVRIAKAIRADTEDLGPDVYLDEQGLRWLVRSPSTWWAWPIDPAHLGRIEWNLTRLVELGVVVGRRVPNPMMTVKGRSRKGTPPRHYKGLRWAWRVSAEALRLK